MTTGNSDVLQPEEERIDGGKALDNDLNSERVGIIEQAGEHVERLCSDCSIFVNGT